MKKSLVHLLCALCVLTALITIPTTAQTASHTGDVIICMRETGTASLSSVSPDEFSALLSSQTTAEDLLVVPPVTNGASLLDGSAETYVIKHVVSDVYTTEQLIAMLSALPNVESAEPNVCFSLNGFGEQDIEGDPLFRDRVSYEDYTALQWGFSDEYSPYSMDVPGWNDPTNINACGVIAVLDSGVDYTHPDLDDVMWDEGLAYPALTALGGGKYGYCVCGDDPSDPMDIISHGTHCAGIIAAEWNDFGTSGIANGVRIMAVKAGNSTLFMSDILKGYQYILTAKASGVNVVAVNNSWGGIWLYPAVDLAVKALGEAGIVSVFASGNFGFDGDTMSISSSTLKSNPYAVTVNASDTYGALAVFSNYGSYTTDLAAPGKDIYSTIPRAMGEAHPTHYLALTDFEKDGQSDFAVAALPDGTAFSAETAYCATTDSYALKISTPQLIDGLRFSIQPKEGVLTDETAEAWKNNSFLNLTMTLAHDLAEYPDAELVVSVYAYCVPENDPYAEPQYIKIADSDKKDAVQSISVPLLVPVIRNENLKQVKYLPAPLFGKDLSDPAYRTFDVSIILAGYEGIPEEKLSVWLDDIGISNTETFAYKYMSGTSMATPAVTGEVALLAKAFPSDSAAKRAARIVANVSVPDPAPEPPCTVMPESSSVSGGIANVRKALSGTQSVPVVRRAVREGDRLTVEGFFFGNTAGKISWNQEDLTASVLSWSDECIKVSLPQNKNGGMITVTVTTSDGRSGHMTLMIPAERELYPRKDVLPISADDCAMLSPLVADGALYAFAVPLDCYPFAEKARFVCYRDGQWTEGAPLSDAFELSFDILCGPKFIDVGGQFIGIMNNMNFENILLAYDRASDSWSRKKLQKDFEASLVGASLLSFGDVVVCVDSYGILYEIDPSTAKASKTDFALAQYEGEASPNQHYLSALAQKTSENTFCVIFGLGPTYTPNGNIEEVTVNVGETGVRTYSSRILYENVYRNEDGKDYFAGYPFVGSNWKVFSAGQNGIFVTGFRVADETGRLHDSLYFDLSTGDARLTDKSISYSPLIDNEIVWIDRNMLYAYANSPEEGDIGNDVRFFVEAPLYELSLVPGSGDRSYTVAASGTAPSGGVLAVALYDRTESGVRLTDVKVYPHVIGEAVTGDFRGKQGSLVKAFFLDSLSLMKARCAGAELEFD